MKLKMLITVTVTVLFAAFAVIAVKRSKKL